jgi:deoxyribonucleoside regulator
LHFLTGCDISNAFEVYIAQKEPYHPMPSHMEELIEICRLHFEEGYSKVEISKMLDMTAISVGRRIKEARDTGLVKIEINPPYLKARQNELVSRYKCLKKAIVVHSSNDFIFERRLCAKAAAEYFDEKVDEKMKQVALGGGNTMYDMVTALPFRDRDLEIYPTAIMGRGPTIETPDRAVIMSLLWSKSGNEKVKAYYASILPAENIKSVKELQQEHDKFLKEREIVRQVFEGMQKVECVFTGLGLVKQNPDYARISPPTALRRLNEMKVFPQDMEQVPGAVGEVSYDFFDVDGNSREEWKLAISIGVEQLKTMVGDEREVVMVAGRYREQALKAALNGGLLNVLITDSRTAETLLTN